MTELKEELKVRPEEGAVEYAERSEATLNRHNEETGERIQRSHALPGESRDEMRERLIALNAAEDIREAEEERHGAEQENGTNQQEETNVNKMNSSNTSTPDERSRYYRTKTQERDVERAVSEFESAKKRLYRPGGPQIFSGEEHAERLGILMDELREKTEAVATEAEADVVGYEREALALSYTDFAWTVPAEGREQLQSSRVFVKEDCETLNPSTLARRLEAVCAGSDKVAKVLHARYARMRHAALAAESSRLAAAGSPVGASVAGENRALGDAVASLEKALEDPQKVKRTAGLKEAASESRRVAREAKAKVSSFDGTRDAAKERQREVMRRAM
jgi:hypothetical protein